MAVNIPNPHEANFGGGLFQALIQRQQTQHANQQLAQQWQRHLQDIEMQKAQQEIQKQQQARLTEQFNLEKQYHPYKISSLQNAEAQAPLELEALKAKIMAMQNLAAQRTPEYAAQQEALKQQKDEEKRNQQLQDFEKKEKIKAQNKGEQDLFAPTKTIQNQAQKTIIAINTVKPLLEDLMNATVPGKFEKNFKPAKAAYASMLQGLGTEEFQSIFNLPKDQHSVKLAESMVDRKMFESLDDYRSRLKDLFGRIMHKGQMMNDVLSNKTVKFDKGHPTQGSTGDNSNDPLGIL